MPGLFTNLKAFVHSLTTADHYAPYEPGTTASPADHSELLSAEYRGVSGSRTSLQDTTVGYTAGSRSRQFNPSSNTGSTHSLPETASTNSPAINSDPASAEGIPLGEFASAGPLPSIPVAWSRIEKWLDNNYPELFEQLLDPASARDLKELEHDLDCVLPDDVKESIRLHDGQERGGKPTGVVYGFCLLDLESILEEWLAWRNAAVHINGLRSAQSQPAPKPQPGPVKPQIKPVSFRSSLRKHQAPQSSHHQKPVAFTQRQQSLPRDAVQPVYAHPGWIPMVKDFTGNNIGIDVAPGPRGQVGQVILFGREYDTKVVVAPSWAHFLMQLAEDLDSGAVFVDDNVDAPTFAYKHKDGRLASYFEVLSRRTEATLAKSRSSSRVPNTKYPARPGRTSQSLPGSRMGSVSGSATSTPHDMSPSTSAASLSLGVPAESSVIPLTPIDTQNQKAFAKSDEADQVTLSDNKANDADKPVEDAEAAKDADIKAVKDDKPVKAEAPAKAAEADLENELSNVSLTQ